MRFVKRHPEILFALVILGLAGIVGSYDFEDAKLEEAAYCRGVENGEHSDYDHIYESACVKR